jgi:hypothetical protein
VKKPNVATSPCLEVQPLPSGPRGDTEDVRPQSPEPIPLMYSSRQSFRGAESRRSLEFLERLPPILGAFIGAAVGMAVMVLVVALLIGGAATLVYCLVEWHHRS